MGIMKEHMTNNTETETTVPYIELGAAARGTIEASPEQHERLYEFTERVGSGEFHRSLPDGMTIPMRCVDGRIPINGTGPLGPNSAGGSESIFVADDLTTQRYVGKNGSTLEAYTNTLDALIAKALPIGGHTDSHAADERSGCGANDKLAAIYTYIAENSDGMRALAAQLGVDVENEDHQLIVGNAAARQEFSAGAELLKVLSEKAKAEYVDHLDGDHREILTVINLRPGVTLDRDALHEEFGDLYQAFNVDVPALAEAAELTSENPVEARQKFIAMVYYNLATAAVLSGPGMRVVTLH